MANYKIIISGVVFGTIVLAMFIASLLFLIGALDEVVDTSIKYLCMIVFSVIPAFLASWIFINSFFKKEGDHIFTKMISFIIAVLMIISFSLGISHNI